MKNSQIITAHLGFNKTHFTRHLRTNQVELPCIIEMSNDEVMKKIQKMAKTSH